MARSSARAESSRLGSVWRCLGEIIAADKSAYRELNNLCIWAKTNGVMGSLYRSQHELVFVFKVGTDAVSLEMSTSMHWSSPTELVHRYS